MLHDLENTIILSLTNILEGNKVDTESIVKALELICNNFSFDCGLIYETDFTKGFCLMEHYTSRDMEFPKNVAIKEIVMQEWFESSQKKIVYIKRNVKNMPIEIKLLDFYNAESLIMIPVPDENGSTYGFVLLFNIEHKEVLDEMDLKILFTMLLMLIRYIEMRMYQKKLLQSRTILENILDNTGIDIYVNDFYSHEILYTNKSMAEPYGGKEQLIGKKCWSVLFPGQTGQCDFCPQNKLIDEQGKPTKVYSWDYQRSFDGSWFRVFSTAFKWVDGRLAHAVSSADITDNKRNEALIENMANFDQLTKLPNRRMLVKECDNRINEATETERWYLLFLDIDGFKSVNDKFGHDAGDEFLVQLGEFFSGIPLLKDAIYRNGGDEFVAIVGGEAITEDNIKSLSNFIHGRFKKVWKLKKGEIFCDISIGVACYPEDGVVAETLLQKADIAMYRVKKSGGGGLCFGYKSFIE